MSARDIIYNIVRTGVQLDLKRVQWVDFAKALI